MTNETQVMPAVALRGITILPDMIVHFDVSRKKSIRAIEEAMTKDQRIFLITQKDPKVEEPSEDDLYKIGTVAMIKQVAKAPKDMLRVLVEGMERAELMQLEDGTSYLEAEVDVLEQEEENLPDTVKEAMLLSMRELFSVYCKENQKMNQEQVRQTLEIDDITDLVDHIAVNIPLTFKQRQQILESTSFSERYEILGVILSNEIEVMRLRTEIQEKVKQRIDKNQRDYILREQLKLIREELGEDDTVSDGDHFMQEAEKLQAPKEIKERLIKEIRRFKSLGYNNSESSVSRGYIETLLKLPWEKSSRDNRNLDKASQILEADHYGLEKVKERVLEFLAVRIRLLGRMKFRSSYGQNALKHSIEVAQLSGLLAAEVGTDIRLAKRAGLLHDIGKSIDHEVEGSHIQIGVDLCRKYKESPIVINAVEAHHGDVEPESLIAGIVQAADAISAARPGARRETLETYTNRLKQLEDITNSFKGVDKSYAIQAGREVRIMVLPDHVNDSDMVLLARDISKQIEAELEYPGQIKVSVIRESRVVDYAK